jgi:NurA-like 5'-3' nuclease
LNLGEIGKASIVRIEMPQYYAQIQKETKMMHNILLHQARSLNGYPYVLARAHEQAVVTTQDKAALDDLLARNLMDQGIIPRSSDKALQKSYLGQG